MSEKIGILKRKCHGKEKNREVREIEIVYTADLIQLKTETH